MSKEGASSRIELVEQVIPSPFPESGNEEPVKVEIPVELKYCEWCGRPFIRQIPRAGSMEQVAVVAVKICRVCAVHPPEEDTELHILRSYRLSPGVKI